MVCSSFPGLKRTAFPGGMATSAPVLGFRPMPVFRGRTLKMQKPRSSMRSPLASARFILSNTVSTAISAFVLVMPVLETTSFTMSSLITVASGGPPDWDHQHQAHDRIEVKQCQAADTRALHLLTCPIHLTGNGNCSRNRCPGLSSHLREIRHR